MKRSLLILFFISSFNLSLASDESNCEQCDVENSSEVIFKDKDNLNLEEFKLPGLNFVHDKTKDISFLILDSSENS